MARASNLVCKFIMSSAYIRCYCDSYGGDPTTLPKTGSSPPTREHSENLGKSLLDWAIGIDDAAIRIHKEEDLAKLDQTEEKISMFYIECLRRSIYREKINKVTG